MDSIQARFKIQWSRFSLDVDLEIPGNGVTAVFGPSGSGKTTVLRCLAGLERASSGFLQVAGEVWQDDTRFVPTHKRPLGYVFQETSLFSHLSVSENLHYGMKRAGAGGREHLAHLVRLLGVENLLDRRPESLSGGEQQRVGIARALAANPRILLMDEPLSALDFKLKQEIVPYLERLHQELEIPILYVSHSLDEVLRLADHLVCLDAGRVVAAGPTAEVITRLDRPLANSREAESMIEARVVGHDAEFRLTHLEVEGQYLFVPQRDLPVGSPMRVRILARDVSITLKRQAETSILNVFAARIDAMAEQDDGQMLLRLMVGDTPLLSRISRKSCVALELSPGKQVYAQVKSTAYVP